MIADGEKNTKKIKKQKTGVPFVMPTYAGGKSIAVGRVYFAVPDGCKICADADNTLIKNEGDLLRITLIKNESEGIDKDADRAALCAKLTGSKKPKYILQNENIIIAYSKNAEAGKEEEPYWISYYVVMLTIAAKAVFELRFNYRRSTAKNYNQAVENFGSRLGVDWRAAVIDESEPEYEEGTQPESTEEAAYNNEEAPELEHEYAYVPEQENEAGQEREEAPELESEGSAEPESTEEAAIVSPVQDYVIGQSVDASQPAEQPAVEGSQDEPGTEQNVAEAYEAEAGAAENAAEPFEAEAGAAENAAEALQTVDAGALVQPVEENGWQQPEAVTEQQPDRLSQLKEALAVAEQEWKDCVQRREETARRLEEAEKACVRMLTDKLIEEESYKLQINNRKAELNSREELIEQLENGIKDLKQKREGYKASLKQIRENCRVRSEAMSKQRVELVKNLFELNSEMSGIREEKNDKKNKLKSAFLFKKKKQQEYDEAKKRLNEKDSEIKAIDRDIKDLDDRLETLKDNTENEIKNLKEEISRVAESEHELQRRVVEAKEEIKVIKEGLSSLEEQIKNYEQSHANDEKERDRYRKQYAYYDTLLKDKTFRRDSLLRELQEMTPDSQ